MDAIVPKGTCFDFAVVKSDCAITIIDRGVLGWPEGDLAADLVLAHLPVPPMRHEHSLGYSQTVDQPF